MQPNLQPKRILGKGCAWCGCPDPGDHVPDCIFTGMQGHPPLPQLTPILPTSRIDQLLAVLDTFAEFLSDLDGAIKSCRRKMEKIAEGMTDGKPDETPTPQG